MDVESAVDRAEVIRFPIGGKVAVRLLFPDPDGGGTHSYSCAIGDTEEAARESLRAFLRLWDAAGRPRVWSRRAAIRRFGPDCLPSP